MKDLPSDPIDAIYVFHDPRDWGLDSQIILDLLRSDNGKVGTLSRNHRRPPPSNSQDASSHDPSRHASQSPAIPREHNNSHPSLHTGPSIPIYFSNPDLLWANQYPLPRFGQGAFKILIEGLYRATTGHKLKSTSIGKPHGRTYQFAERVLREYLHSRDDGNAVGTSPNQASKHPLKGREGAEGEGEGVGEGVGAGGALEVYMVGDNPASDIQGANQHGWTSILVRTGVFRGSDEEGMSGEIPAKKVVGDVFDAVEGIIALHDGRGNGLEGDSIGEGGGEREEMLGR